MQTNKFAIFVLILLLFLPQVNHHPLTTTDSLAPRDGKVLIYEGTVSTSNYTASVHLEVNMTIEATYEVYGASILIHYNLTLVGEYTNGTPLIKNINDKRGVIGEHVDIYLGDFGEEFGSYDILLASTPQGAPTYFSTIRTKEYVSDTMHEITEISETTRNGKMALNVTYYIENKRGYSGSSYYVYSIPYAVTTAFGVVTPEGRLSVHLVNYSDMEPLEVKTIDFYPFYSASWHYNRSTLVGDNLDYGIVIHINYTLTKAYEIGGAYRFFGTLTGYGKSIYESNEPCLGCVRHESYYGLHIVGYVSNDSDTGFMLLRSGSAILPSGIAFNTFIGIDLVKPKYIKDFLEYIISTEWNYPEYYPDISETTVTVAGKAYRGYLASIEKENLNLKIYVLANGLFAHFYYDEVSDDGKEYMLNITMTSVEGNIPLPSPNTGGSAGEQRESSMLNTGTIALIALIAIIALAIVRIKRR